MIVIESHRPDGLRITKSIHIPRDEPRIQKCDDGWGPGIPDRFPLNDIGNRVAQYSGNYVAQDGGNSTERLKSWLMQQNKDHHFEFNSKGESTQFKDKFFWKLTNRFLYDNQYGEIHKNVIMSDGLSRRCPDLYLPSLRLDIEVDGRGHDVNSGPHSSTLAKRTARLEEI